MPADLLDRLLIIRTDPYDEKDLRMILKTRCEEEDVNLDESGLNILTKIGLDSSLRYAIQLINTSALNAKRRKLNQEDIRKLYSLFLDEKEHSEIANMFHFLPDFVS